MLETLEGDTVATVVIAFLVASGVKGALGMGLPTISVAIMDKAVGLREAIPVLMIPSFLTNLWQGTWPGPVMPLFKRLGMMNLAACIGIWLGTIFLIRIDTVIINSLFGSVVILYALLNLTRVEFTLEPGREPLFGRTRARATVRAAGWFLFRPPIQCQRFAAFARDRLSASTQAG